MTTPTELRHLADTYAAGHVGDSVAQALREAADGLEQARVVTDVLRAGLIQIRDGAWGSGADLTAFQIREIARAALVAALGGEG